jgi:hypothetical protein
VVDPVDGTSDVTVGTVAAGSKYVKIVEDNADWNPLEVVVIEAGPAVGVPVEPVVHRTSVAEMYSVVSHTTPAMVRVAMSAAVRPSAVPVIVTTVPPVIEPEVGAINVIKGPLGITGPPDPAYANPRAGTVVVNTPPDGDDTVTGD